MAESVQDVWARFERWEKRYTTACAKEIGRICRRGYSDGPTLFLLKSHEMHGDPVLDFGLDEDDLNSRIKRRIQFIRGYLVDISSDGEKFMSMHSKFLHLQYPKRSESAMGVWLEQSMEGKTEPGTYFGFQDFDISFFVNRMEDIDLASMRGVLPFKWMHLHKADGSKWSQEERSKLRLRLKDDLCFDGYDHRVRTHQNGSLLTLTFEWL